jgi:chorismate dehydratase
LLAQILLRDYWNLKPELLSAPTNYIDHISGNKAGVIIGDRTFGLEQRFPFVYDLSAAWHEMTGLPFVFAAWVSNKTLTHNFLDRFNNALSDGITRIEQVAQLFQSSHFNIDVFDYLSKYISYDLDTEKKKGLELFLKMIDDM